MKKKKASVKRRKKAPPKRLSAPELPLEVEQPQTEVHTEAAPANNGAQVTPFSVLSGGGDLQTGYNFTDGELCTAAKLNDAVNLATVQPGFVSGKPTSTPLATDTTVFLQTSSGQLKATTLSTLMTLAAIKSVGLALPADTFVITPPNPITANGTLTATHKTQNSNFFLAGPAPGSSSGVPSWRHTVPADIYFPALGATVSTGSTTIDWTTGQIFYRLLAASPVNIVFANPFDQRILIVLEQGSPGSRTVTWPAGIHWDTGGPPALATVAGAKDVIEVFTCGTVGYFGKLWGRTT